MIYDHFGGRSQDGDFVYADATCATYGSSPGDSGAPVYKRKGADGAEAHGMHFSSHFDNETHQRDSGCYADIDNIERAGGVALLTGSASGTGSCVAGYSEASMDRPCAIGPARPVDR